MNVNKKFVCSLLLDLIYAENGVATAWTFWKTHTNNWPKTERNEGTAKVKRDSIEFVFWLHTEVFRRWNTDVYGHGFFRDPIGNSVCWANADYACECDAGANDGGGDDDNRQSIKQQKHKNRELKTKKVAPEFRVVWVFNV